MAALVLLGAAAVAMQVLYTSAPYVLPEVARAIAPDRVQDPPTVTPEQMPRGKVPRTAAPYTLPSGIMFQKFKRLLLAERHWDPSPQARIINPDAILPEDFADRYQDRVARGHYTKTYGGSTRWRLDPNLKFGGYSPPLQYLPKVDLAPKYPGQECNISRVSPRSGVVPFVRRSTPMQALSAAQHAPR